MLESQACGGILWVATSRVETAQSIVAGVLMY